MPLRNSQVARTASSPAQHGNLSPLDIAHAAYAAGFRGAKLTVAVAIAMAETGGTGNPKAVSPTQDYGLWQINRPSWPQYFRQANRIFDPVYNATAAFHISKGGTNWGPWTTYRTSAYKHWLGQGIPTGAGADDIIKGGVPSNGGGWNPVGNAEGAVANAVSGIGNPIKWADEAAKAIVGFLKLMVDPEKLGRHIANVALWLLKQFVKGFYNIIVLPPWRWSQRSTMYYYRNVINEGGPTVIGVKAIATMGFWAIGYGILWGRFEPTEMRGVAPGDTAMAGTMNMARNAVVARRITKPKDVDKATAKKPKPVATTIPVTKVRIVAASRRRAVKVTPARAGTPATPGEAYRITNAVGKVIDKELLEDIGHRENHERDRGQGHRRHQEGEQQQEVIHQETSDEA